MAKKMVKNSIYRITILGWDKYNKNLKKGHKAILISTGFLSDAKIRCLTPANKLLFLSCLFVAGESTSAHIEVTHESLVYQSGVKSGSLKSHLDLLQSLQLVTYEEIDLLLNRIEKKVIEKNIIEDKGSCAEAQATAEEKTTAEFVGNPAAETKDTLGPIEEFSKSEILRPVLGTIAKSAQRQWLSRYKDTSWLVGNLEDAVSYYTASGEGNPKTWGKLLVLWLKRSKDKPTAFKVASGITKDPFDFNPYPDAGGEA